MANALLDKAQRAGKAIAGALAGAIVSTLFTTITDPNAVINPDAPESASKLVQLPNTEAEWIAFGAAVLLSAALPWLRRNYPSVVQAEQQLVVARDRVAQGKQTQ